MSVSGDDAMSAGSCGCLFTAFVLALQVALVVFKIFGLLDPWSWWEVFVPILTLFCLGTLALVGSVIIILLS